MKNSLKKRTFDNIPVELVTNWERKQNLPYSLLKMKRQYDFNYRCYNIVPLIIIAAVEIVAIFFLNRFANHLVASANQFYMDVGKVSLMVTFLILLIIPSSYFYIVTLDKVRDYFVRKIMKFEHTLFLFFKDIEALKIEECMKQHPSFKELERYYRDEFLPPHVKTMVLSEQNFVAVQQNRRIHATGINEASVFFAKVRKNVELIFAACERFGFNFYNEEEYRRIAKKSIEQSNDPNINILPASFMRV